MKIPSAWRRLEWVGLVILFAAVTAFHARGLRPGYAFLPIDAVTTSLPWRTPAITGAGLQNNLIADPIYQFYPFLVLQLNAVRAGHWPLWSPQLLLGHPMVGDPLAQTFYPVFIGLGLVFGPARGLTIGFWLHALLAAGLTYGWLRAAGLGWRGALAGSLVYALGGYMVTALESTFWVSTLAWLPGVLWMYEVAVRRRSLPAMVGAGLMFGLATLGGQISFAALFAAFLTFYGLGHVLDADAARAGRRFQAWPLLGLGVTLVLGGLLACAQLLPFLETLAQSQRTSAVAFGALPFQQIVTWLVPNFYGNPSTTHSYWGALNYFETVVYAGVVALLLAVLAPLVSRRFWPTYLFLLGVANLYVAYGGPGVGLLAALPMVKYLAVSRSTFLLPLITGYLAGVTIESVRPPVRTVVVVALGLAAVPAWAWIANWGAAREHAAELRGPLVWAGAMLAGTVLLLMAGRTPSRRRWVDGLLVGLLFVDLFAVGSRFNPAQPIASLPQPTPAIKFLQDQATPYRIATLELPQEYLIGPNYLTVFGLNDLSGYSSLLPLRLKELVVHGDPDNGSINSNVNWLRAPSLRLLDLFQAGFVVSSDGRADTSPRAEHLGGCASQTHELTRDQPIAASLPVSQTAINRLDLTVRVAPGAVPTGTLTVQMWQGADRARLVLQDRADLSVVRDHQALTFFFAPEQDAPGHVYAWEVSTTGAQTGVALCAEADGAPSASLFGADWRLDYQDRLFVAERLGPLPRAYVVYSAETIVDERPAVLRVLDDSFDLRNSAVVRQAVPLPVRSDLPATPAELIHYGDTDIVLRVTAAGTGLLVLGDQFYPGWQAWVDGQPAPVLPANIIWRGVLLPPGEHQVEFKFFPASLKLGLALAGLGLFLAAGLLIIRRRPPAA